MRAYSSADLLQLDFLKGEESSFTNRVKMWAATASPTVTLPILVPKRYYIRCNLFCKTIRQTVAEEENRYRKRRIHSRNIKFGQNDLCTMLLRELEQLYTRRPNPTKLLGNLRYLANLPRILHYYGELIIREGALVRHVPKNEEEEMHRLNVRIDRELVHDMEVLISDLDEILTHKDEQYTVEKVLEFAYTNFISDMIDGKGEKYIARVLYYLDIWDEEELKEGAQA